MAIFINNNFYTVLAIINLTLIYHSELKSIEIGPQRNAKTLSSDFSILRFKAKF